jgi:DNA recombination protein RmuC
MFAICGLGWDVRGSWQPEVMTTTAALGLIGLGVVLGIVVGVGTVLLITHRRRQGVGDVLAPVAAALQAINERTEQLHEIRRAGDAALAEQLRSVRDQYGSLHTVTEHIRAALTRGDTRGQWGEMQLERLLEHAGLLEGVHFRRQHLQEVDGDRIVPDISILLPNGGHVFIDAKFPFDAFWQACDPLSGDGRTTALAKHARDVLSRANELANRGYSRSSASPDFVVMFLPFESLLSAALEADSLILEKTFEKRVVLATPTTMLALCRTIAFGYDRAAMAHNAEEIRIEGAEMLKRLGTLVEHIETMRRGIAGAVSGFNAFVGSFDRQALSQARRLQEMGVTSTKSLDTPAEIDQPLRAVSDP